MRPPGLLAALLCLLGLALASRPSHAATPLTLPPTEATEDWAAAVALVGFELAPPGDGPWVVLIAAVPEWQLLVQDSAGAVHRVSSPPPRSEVEREELLFLATSLLHADAPLGDEVGAAADEETSAVVVARAEPAPRPASPAAPEPPLAAEPLAPAPAPLPEAGPPAPSGSSLGLGALARQGAGAGPRPGLLLRLVLEGPGGVALGLDARALSAAALRDQPEERTVAAVGAGAHLGLRLAESLRPTLWLGPALELRSFREGGEARGRPWVGLAEAWGSLDLPVAGGVIITPALGAGLALRPVEILDEGGRSRLSPLTVGLSLTAAWSPRDPGGLMGAWRGRSPEDSP